MSNPKMYGQVFKSVRTLGFLIKLSAGKDRMIKTRQELEAEGWKAASVTGGDHLKRTLEVYEELGIEVHLEEVKPEECDGCTKCFTADNETMFRIYTRQHFTS